MSYLKSFASYLEVDRDMSENTIQSYVRDVKNFSKHVGKDLTDVEQSDVRSFISHLIKLGRKRSSISRVTFALKSFYKYLKDIEQVIDRLPTDNIKIDNREKSLPKAISQEDIIKLLNTASSLGIKQRLLLELFYGLGGRVSEVVSLKVEDIDFSNNFIRIVGKGNKERHNPIHDSCIDLIKTYMKSYGISSGFLFPNSRDNSKHMTRENAYHVVKRVAKLAGVNPDLVSPHVFRHSFATHLLDNGCDIGTVQEYLGHENISTTKIYAKVTRNNKARSFNKFHPLAQ